MRVHWVFVSEQDMSIKAKGDKPPEVLVPNPKLRLREQLREVMRFKHHSPRTEPAQASRPFKTAP
ncbi:MAG: hypothetical protein WCS99_21000 [Limisphaerales bacterium]